MALHPTRLTLLFLVGAASLAACSFFKPMAGEPEVRDAKARNDVAQLKAWCSGADPATPSTKIVACDEVKKLEALAGLDALIKNEASRDSASCARTRRPAPAVRASRPARQSSRS